MQNTRDLANITRMQDRLNKQFKESNYKTDSDIFNIRVNKNIQNAKYYKKTAKEITESRIDNKNRVYISIFISGLFSICKW